MPSFHQRFVGATTLPRSLSKEDAEEAFGPSDADIAELKGPRFRGIGRLGAAVLLVFVRATGRWPETLVNLPKSLLHNLCKAVGVPVTDIGSLTTLYRRDATRFEHQRWARE